MYVRTNVSSLKSLNYIEKKDQNLKLAMERLSTGKRINSAKDDAAGLAISERFKRTFIGNNKSFQNLEMGQGLTQTAEGGLNNMKDMVQRMRELMLRAGNDTTSIEDKITIQGEVDELKKEINHIANTTEFNGINLLNNTETIFDNTSTVRIGANGSVSYTDYVPPKDPEEGSILTITTDNTLTGETITPSMSIGNNNMSDTHNWTMDATLAAEGYRISKATVKVTANGDLDDGNEHVELRANGSYIGRRYSDGATTFDISSAVNGGTTIDLEGLKSAYVNNANVSFELDVEYEKLNVRTVTETWSEYASGSTSNNDYQTYSAPAGEVMQSASLSYSASGDIDNTGEYIQVYANGSFVDTVGSSYGGTSGTANITSKVENDGSIQIRTYKDPDVWNVSTNYSMTYTTKKVLSDSQNFGSNLSDPTNEDTYTYNMPIDLNINTASITANVTGDIHRDDEIVSLFANGSKIGEVKGSGGSITFDGNAAKTLLSGSPTLELKAVKGGNVGFTNVNWSVDLTYRPDEDTLKATSPTGDTYGTGEAYLNGTTSEGTVPSSIASYYSPGADAEKFTIYNPEEGNWTTTIENPSSNHWYDVSVNRLYEKAKTIDLHTGWGDDNRESFRLSKITTDTLGIRNIDTFDYQNSVTQLDSALEMIMDEQKRYGGLNNHFQNQMEHLKKENTTISSTNQRILDADMAKESSNMLKEKVSLQVASNTLLKSNEYSRNVLAILQF